MEASATVADARVALHQAAAVATASPPGWTEIEIWLSGYPLVLEVWS